MFDHAEVVNSERATRARCRSRANGSCSRGSSRVPERATLEGREEPVAWFGKQVTRRAGRYRSMSYGGPCANAGLRTGDSVGDGSRSPQAVRAARDRSRSSARMAAERVVDAPSFVRTRRRLALPREARPRGGARGTASPTKQKGCRHPAPLRASRDSTETIIIDRPRVGVLAVDHEATSRRGSRSRTRATTARR